MLRRIAVMVMAMGGVAIAGIGPSHMTTEGVERVYSASSPADNGSDALILNLFRINGNFQTTYPNYDTTTAGTLAEFNDFRAYGSAFFGLGYAVPLTQGLSLEGAFTASYLGDYWDRMDSRGNNVRRDPYNRSSMGLGDMNFVMKLGYRFPNRMAAIGIAPEFTFPAGAVLDTTSPDTSSSFGIKTKGGLWRTFTQDNMGFGGRFLTSFYPVDGNVQIHLNLGYNTRDNKDATDDVFQGGAALVGVLGGVFMPFVEVYTEQFIKDTVHGEGPVWLTGGFRLDFGKSGLVMDIAGEKMFGARDAGNQDNQAMYPDFWAANWNPDFGVWFGLNYTWQGVFIKPEVKPATGTIAVAVMDEETRKPIPDATVAVPGANISPKAVDPSTGFVKIDSVLAGQYTLQVSAPNYEAYAQAVIVQEGEISQQNVFLKKIKEQVTTGTIVGRVVDAETGQPIDNAVISFPQNAQIGSFNVEAAGTFKSEQIAAGTYTVQASAPGYQPGSQMITLKAGETQTVEIKLHKETPNVAVVTGRVYNADDNTNISGAYITLKGGSTVSPVTSDENGIYRIENVPAGTYTIKATAAGYKDVSEVIQLQKGQVLIKDFPLAPSVTKGMLVVQVVDKKNGNPLPATLTFVGTSLPTAQTDPTTGVWQGEVPTGTYTVNAVVGGGLKGYVPQVKTVVVNKGQAAQLRFEMVKKGLTITFRNIYFKVGSAKLLPSANPALNEILTFLNENPTAKIEIQGHTSTEGSESYNQRLSENRANSVRSWLIRNGISADRLVAVGYGESSPEIFPEKSEEDRKMNRRVVIKVIGEVQ